MTKSLDNEIREVLARMENQENQKQEQDTQTPHEEIQDVYVLIVREQEESEPTQVVDSAPVIPQNISYLPAYAIGFLYLLLILSTLAFQLSCLVNPPIATVTIMPKSQTVTLSGTVQLGRILSPFTLSQSQTTPTTGKGHQSAKAASGYITLYNGQFQSVTIAAGTILTGASGIQMVTDQDATIPPANPPIFGHVSVLAHAVHPGVRGNIPAYAINQACCAPSVLAKNTQGFAGGQDERDFPTVSIQDISKVSTPLKTSLAQSVAGALQGQLKQGEAVQLLPCRPTVASDHPIGAEATQVNVTVAETCSAVAYTSQALTAKATAFLSTQALQHMGTGYSLVGHVHVSVKDATVTNGSNVFLSFLASGTWVYTLSQSAQQHIKSLITGKTTQEAVRLVEALPGIEHASIHLNAFGDETRLPKRSSAIHLSLCVV